MNYSCIKFEENKNGINNINQNSYNSQINNKKNFLK